MRGFSGFGNSPVKQRKKYTKKDYDFLKEQREERVKSTDYLTKTPTGPRATKKNVKDDDVPLSPGFEDPIKIQKVQREGITPHSQKFSKKAKKSKKKIFKKFNPKDFEFLNFENPKDRDKIYNKTEIKRK